MATTEARCTELGSGCICSEILDSASYIESPTDFWRASDASAKPCSQDGTGRPVVRTATVAGTNDATMLAALPAGATVSYALWPDEDEHEGTFFVGNGDAVSGTLVRLAARWYIYHTPVFDFKLEGTCDNSKIAELNNGSLVDYTTPNFHTYNYTTWSPSVDCCVSGPGPDNNVPSADMKGNWWRFELVITNRSGPDYRLQMYGKNVTDDEAEIEMIDLWDNASVDNLTPPSLMSMLLSNNHRFAAAGVCRGWLAISYYMMAGWTSDAGQRIGAASEIEGGAPPPPVAGSRPGFPGRGPVW